MDPPLGPMHWFQRSPNVSHLEENPPFKMTEFSTSACCLEPEGTNSGTRGHERDCWKCRAQLESNVCVQLPWGNPAVQRGLSDSQGRRALGSGGHFSRVSCPLATPLMENQAPQQDFFLLLKTTLSRSRAREVLFFRSGTFFFSSPASWTPWLFWNLKLSTLVYFLTSSLRFDC